MKTISELNKTVWYRLIKVIFIVLFAILFLEANYCLMTASYGVNLIFIESHFGFFSIESHINPFVLLFIVDVLVLIIFEGIRRAFYYTYFGSFKPQK